MLVRLDNWRHRQPVALRIRLTETTGTALLAVTGLVSAVIIPAMKQLKSRAAAICLNRTPDTYHMAQLPSPAAQNERALSIRRPKNTAVSDKPNTLVVARSLVLVMAPSLHFRGFCSCLQAQN